MQIAAAATSAMIARFGEFLLGFLDAGDVGGGGVYIGTKGTD